MHRKLTIVGFVALTGLAACGETLGEQAVIGAGAGAATALALDGNIAAGALIGAGANALYCNQNPGAC